VGQIFPVRFVPYDLSEGREKYLSCYRKAWRGVHGSLAGFNETACWLAAAERAGRYPGSLLEARWEDRFAGVLSMDDKRERKAGWIAFCYVEEALRRRGIGRAMIRKAEERYVSRGARSLRLSVAPGNPAVAFYEKLGFRRVGTEPGAFEDLYVMEKEL
jgi:ribosomal protein S18 acetylase RimI-like enzyme